MLTNIQFLRAFAALSVVIYHTSFVYRGAVHTEFQGVAIFFVISGFIMTFISRKGHEGFLPQRFVRILPLYWLVTLAIFLVKLKAQLPLRIFHYLAIDEGAGVGLTLGALVRSLLFIPYRNAAGDWQPIDGVGWTLNLEMYFYVVFAIALLASARFAPIIAAMAILAIKLFANSCTSDVCEFYGHDYITYFVLGIATYYLWARAQRRLVNARATVALCAVIVAAVFFAWHLAPEFVALCSPAIAATVDHALPPLMVFAALCLNSIGLRSDWRPILLLGDASYALYLIHPVVIGQLRIMGHLVDAQSGVGMLIAVLAISCASAVTLHYAFELPVTRRLRSLLHLRRNGRRNGEVVAQSSSEASR